MSTVTALPLPSERAGESAGKAGTAAKSRLDGVEAARGVAALLVVFYHSALHVEGNVGGTILWHLTHFGHAGVDFFFVLSGFIITFVHRKDIGSPGRLGHYLQRRFTRVLPFYWIVLAYYLADIWLLHPARAPGLWELCSNLLLLPQHADQIVGGAWTLVFELMFYTLFAFMIVSRRLGSALLVLWAGLICTGFFFHPLHGSVALIATASSPYCFEFLLGMGAAHILASHRVPRTRLLLILGVTGFALAGVCEVRGLLYGYGQMARFIYGGCSMIIIMALVERERSGLLRVPKPLAVLGRASYSVYLVHLIGVGIAFHFISRVFPLTPAWALPLWLVLCACGVTAGILASIWIEHPVIRRSRRWIGDRLAWAR